MELTIKFELSDSEIVDPNLSEEIIKENLIYYIQGLLDWDTYIPGSPELFIDVSDDGHDKYNIYNVQISTEQ